MTTSTSFKDRNLLAVIGDEVRNYYLVLDRFPYLWVPLGFNHRSPASGYRAHKRAPEEEFPSRGSEWVLAWLIVTPAVCITKIPPSLWTLLLLETQISTIEAAFQDFTERKDIAILLINQHVRSSSVHGFCYISHVFGWLQIAEKIRPTVDKYQQAFPALLEIPSKDHPYGLWPVLYEAIECR